MQLNQWFLKMLNYWWWLPRCMGPCSQKLMEHGAVNDSICTVATLDVPLEEYLKFDFQMKLLLENRGHE